MPVRCRDTTKIYSDTSPRRNMRRRQAQESTGRSLANEPNQHSRRETLGCFLLRKKPPQTPQRKAKQGRRETDASRWARKGFVPHPFQPNSLGANPTELSRGDRFAVA